MTVHKLRAVLTAIFLGTAAGRRGCHGHCHPGPGPDRQRKVGPLVKEAQSLARCRQLQGRAWPKLNEAEAVEVHARRHHGHQPAEAVYRGRSRATLPRPRGAKAKFANDYNAGKYKDVIADGEILRKAGALDGQSNC